MKKICCFAGHGKFQYGKDIYSRLSETIEKLIITENVQEFWVGNYGNFDGISGTAVRRLKEKYPHIILNLVIPYLTSELNNNKEFYKNKYDNIIVADMPENTPKRLKIIKCNEYMVKNSDFLICYIEYSWGGAAKTFEFVKKKTKTKIINLTKIQG